jgi:hypothetical protein
LPEFISMRALRTREEGFREAALALTGAPRGSALPGIAARARELAGADRVSLFSIAAGAAEIAAVVADGERPPGSVSARRRERLLHDLRPRPDR